MTCRELTSFIADYLAGELAPDVRVAFDRHLARCPNCVQYVADYQRAVVLGRSVFDDGDTLPEDVPDGLVDAILASRRAREPD